MPDPEVTPPAGDAARPSPEGGSTDDTRPEDRDEATNATTSDRAAPPRRRWGRREYTPEELEEIEEAKQVWRDIRPWESPMRRADKILIGTITAVVLVMLASLPLRPFLLASHPVALAAVTGSSSAIGAGAAFARIGQADLWVVIAAGLFGKIKFDWLYWWAGRRWGAKGVRFFVPTDRAQRFVARVRSWPVWAVPLLLVASALPGVPSVLAFLLAGLAGTRLVTFLVFDAIGAGLLVGLVAGLGYGLGQNAVDVVLTVDRYALWITLGVALIIAVQASRAQSRRQKQRATSAATTDGAPGDAS